MSSASNTGAQSPLKVLSGFAFPPSSYFCGHDEGIPLVRIRDIKSGSTEVNFKGPFDRIYLLTDGDLIVGMDGDFNAVRWTGGPALLNQRVCKIVADGKSIDQGFLFHFLQPQLDLIHRRTPPQTTVRHLSTGALYGIEFPEFSLSEQQKIAEILDTLDDQIRATEQIVEKLRLTKKGLVNDLLSGGGSTVRLGGLASMITSGSRGWARYYSDEGAKFIRIGNLTRDHINLRFDSLVHVSIPSGGEGSRTDLREGGDLLISITADLGIIGVVPRDLGSSYINQHIALVRFDSAEVDSRWVGHFLSSTLGQAQFVRLNDQGAKAGLNLPTVANLEIPLRPVAEQRKVVAVLDAVDSRIALSQREMQKLKRQKQGLMSDLLTGRVRVPTEGPS